MQDALVAPPKPPIARIAAWLMMLLGMWLALKLGLVVTLLSGLLVFQLTHVLASTVEGRLPPGRARAIAVIVLSAIIISALVLAGIGGLVLPQRDRRPGRTAGAADGDPTPGGTRCRRCCNPTFPKTCQRCARR